MKAFRGHELKRKRLEPTLGAGAGAEPGPPREVGHPRTVAFHGGKGGVGATFLAAESAAMLSASGRRVAAVDAHPHRGGLHYRLDVPVGRGSFTVEDLLPALDDLSDRVLDSALSRCPCGAQLLPSASSGSEGGCLNGEHLQSLGTALEPGFQHIIIDTAASRDGAALAGSPEVDMVVLVVVPELSCLGGAGRALEVLGATGSGRRGISLVVNRSLGKYDTITIADIESYLQMPVTMILPEETALCRGLSETGTFAFNGRTPLGRGLRAMARRLFACPGVFTSQGASRA